MTLVKSRPIPFFSYPALFLGEEEQLIDIFRDVGRRGAFILQQDLARFEIHLARYLGAGHALGVGNATDGLILALRAALPDVLSNLVGLPSADARPIPRQDGPEVIFASHTMVATAAAIHFAGAVPVPVECGPDHLIDASAVETAITARTCAILPTQLNGRTADMDALQALASRHGLAVVEDAAQALGSRFKERAAATFGAAAAISFFPAKLLGCLGDGGAVITNDHDVYGRLVELRDHGRRADGEIVSWGLNSRLDNLQAAILDYRLRIYRQSIERRRALAQLYRQRLEGLEELVLPPGPDGDADHFDVYQNYEIEAARRDSLRRFLEARGIGTTIPWGGKAVHQWTRLGFRQRLPFTEQLFERLLLLPLNLALSDDDLHQVCDAIFSFYRD